MTKDPNVFLAHARDCCIRIEAYTQEGNKPLLLTPRRKTPCFATWK